MNENILKIILFFFVSSSISVKNNYYNIYYAMSLSTKLSSGGQNDSYFNGE